MMTESRRNVSAAPARLFDAPASTQDGQRVGSTVAANRIAPPTRLAASLRAPEWPADIDRAALYGIAGEFVLMMDPHTEADPVALLVQLLAAFGSLVGRGPHYRVEGDEHHANLFVLLIGTTSKGRKGTAFGRVRDVFERVPEWKPHVSGLSTGEGLKHAVRDEREVTKEDKNGQMVTQVVDFGVIDKRLLVVEPEFAGVLRAAQRHGCTLSTTIREAWDSGDLRILTKSDPITATGAHISIIGHITGAELRTELTATDTANGFANRFLFVAVRRSKLLPFGGAPIDSDRLDVFAERLYELAQRARTRNAVQMTERASAVWSSVYPALSEGADGLHGAVTARAEAQCVRLALTYALLDGADAIEVPHLMAALAVWQYCEATAKHLFGTSLGDRVADEIIRQLRAAGDAGLTRTEIRDLFQRHRSTEVIGAALERLERHGLAVVESIGTPGRPLQRWKVIQDPVCSCDISDERDESRRASSHISHMSHQMSSDEST
jgi:hypothetical protein